MDNMLCDGDLAHCTEKGTVDNELLFADAQPWTAINGGELIKGGAHGAAAERQWNSLGKRESGEVVLWHERAQLVPGLTLDCAVLQQKDETFAVGVNTERKSVCSRDEFLMSEWEVSPGGGGSDSISGPAHSVA
jgi:hypothetical protein